jgi:hypothetical protein
MSIKAGPKMIQINEDENVNRLGPNEHKVSKAVRDKCKVIDYILKRILSRTD